MWAYMYQNILQKELVWITDKWLKVISNLKQFYPKE